MTRLFARVSSSKRVLIGGLVLVAASAVALWRSGPLAGIQTAPPVFVTAPTINVIDDTLHRGETVSQLFARRGVSDVDFSALARAVRNFDPSRLRSGTVFTFRQRNGEGEPNAVVVRASYDQRLTLVRTADSGWTPHAEVIAWRSEPFVFEGTVRSSVSEAITGAIQDSMLPSDARVQLVWALADVYDWSVDFSRDVQPGDKFRVLAERMVSNEGEVRYGRVLAARLDIGTHPLYAFRFDDPDGMPAYYDETGHSMKRALLRAPLQFKRISSGFSKHRFHPILGYSRPHEGIDFAAAYGTPVRAVGNGTVIWAARQGGYGNLVEIRHSGTMTTRYGHLSAFGAGIHAGARVEQGQTIGFVGASGLATGPHLHYELRLNGVAVNPKRSFGTGEGAAIPEARRPAFLEEKTHLLEQMEQPTNPNIGAMHAVD